MNKYIALTFLTALVAIALANIFGIPGAHANENSGQLSFFRGGDWDQCLINYETFSQHVAALQDSTNRQSIFASQENLQEVQQSFSTVLDTCILEIMADKKAFGES